MHTCTQRSRLVEVPLWQAVMPLRVRANPVSNLDMAFTPNHALPEGVLHKPKSGFAVPNAQWLAQAAALQAG